MAYDDEDLEFDDYEGEEDKYAHNHHKSYNYDDDDYDFDDEANDDDFYEMD
ncbi:highly acidic protein [Campylobacter coli]|uniref:highly acidic protein n=1 Tax=Campylobacter TaxID=194 RepID=UPI000BBC3C32|nr:highly acidic protein [Campylobacter sp. 110]EAJ2565124.1 highly acidic protein [Campylobacter coli]EAK4055291.1 highly acidic protein [Campylobacter coli]EAK4056631.1 highly acidic protein [Campylobacter coli]EAK4194765.1 highly acidic protein [Campylobacter coli]EAK4737827.1 highly acidic protein [Campylobacter coli]